MKYKLFLNLKKINEKKKKKIGLTFFNRPSWKHFLLFAEISTKEIILKKYKKKNNILEKVEN